jgi:hypothetical protein
MLDSATAPEQSATNNTTAVRIRPEAVVVGGGGEFAVSKAPIDKAEAAAEPLTPYRYVLRVRVGCRSTPTGTTVLLSYTTRSTTYYEGTVLLDHTTSSSS